MIICAFIGGRMPDPDPPEPPDKVQDSIDALLATADRCYRLAAGISDRKTVERLLEMARECEERAAAIRRGAG
jgi:hypothetical protein